jgi:hypothetical protein
MRQNTNHETPKAIPSWEDDLDSINQKITILIDVFPCMLIITQLLFQQNALVY